MKMKSGFNFYFCATGKSFAHRLRIGAHVPTVIASLERIVIMKLLAGRTQDVGDIEAIVDSGADRESLRVAVEKAAPRCLEALERLFGNVDRTR